MRNTKNTTLVVDGNYFVNRTLYIMQRTNGRLLDNDTDYVLYVRKLMMDFAATVRKFKSILNRVVLVCDSASWRKDFYPEANYKGQRVKDDSINWDNFSKAYEEFRNILKKKHVIIHKENGAEGDDLMYAWSRYLNLNGSNCIICTGDHDGLQLIDNNKSTDTYTLFYAPTSTVKELGVYESFNKWLNSETDSDITDIFNISDNLGDETTKTFYKKLISTEKLELKVIDVQKFSFEKVLIGDGGDNVASLYTYEKNGRNYKISEKKAEKVYNKILENYDFSIDFLYDREYREIFTDIILSELKIDKIHRNSILKRFELNVMLLLLNNKSIPEEILSNCYKNIEIMFPINNFDVSLLLNKDIILEGTRFVEDVTSYNFDNSAKSDIDSLFDNLFM